MTRHYNREGLEFTAASAEAVEGYDETVKRYLQFHQDIGGALKTALMHDPQMPMALCLRGYFYMLMGLRPLVDKARQLADGLQAQRELCTAREQLHIDALATWSRDSLRAATRHWELISCDHPRDILAIKMAHFGHFYLGRSVAIRDGIAQAIDFWSPRDELYSYMLSMMSFGLVEAGDLEQAEAYGRRSLELTPQDPWGVHAVAHSLETTKHRLEAIDWIEQHEPQWSQANNFRHHIHWHRALIHLEHGNVQAALDWYDRTVFADGSVEYLDVCNEASLLLRMELNDIALGDRWQAVAQKAFERVNDQAIGFADIHYMMALASSPLAEHTAMAQTLMENLVRYGESGTDNADAYRVAVVPLARALLAFRQGRYEACALDVLGCAEQAHAAGGSHDQRDVYEYLAAEALFRADPIAPRTIAYLARRSFVAPYNRHNWKRYLQALKRAGQEQAFAEAEARCRVALDNNLPEIRS